ncbi:MAG: right-handed parallel beta-helix repeat-containing protein [Patescibacteria group bacterium]|nr:right-handed parallel beta-helix repeat-containing protein [Patescibacteria group bacterium]
MRSTLNLTKAGQSVVWGIATAMFTIATFFVASTTFAIVPLYVDNTVSCDNSTADSSVTPYCTIQAAVNDALDGDTVSVGAGTYAENVTLGEDITLEGAQSGVDARGRSTSETIIAPSSGIGITLTAGVAGATIDGFSISGGEKGIESTSGPLDGLTIQNNIISGFTGTGMFLNNSGIDLTVDRNVVDGSSGTGSGGLVHLDTDNFDGMWFTNNNVVDGAGYTGFFSDGNHNVGESVNRSPKLTGNLFQNNETGANLGRFSWEYAHISSNMFKDNNYPGLQGGIQHSTIEKNTFDGNGRGGLELTGFGGSGDATRGAQYNTITHNIFTGNGYLNAGEGIFLSTGQFPGTIATNDINRNSIAGNAGGMTYDGSEIIDATCNWWGTASGPSGVGPGSGDAATSSLTIDYATWLTSSDLDGPCNGVPTGSIEITKYACPADTVVTREDNGVEGEAPEGCVLQEGAYFGYVHGDAENADGPYPELPLNGGIITEAGATSAGILTIDELSSDGRYLVMETDGAGNQLPYPGSDVLGLYCEGDGGGSNDNQELTFVPAGGVAHCVAYNVASDTTPPDAPVHLSPFNGVVIVPSALTDIDWTDVTDPSTPVTYFYQSSNLPTTNGSGAFSSPVYTSGALSSSHIPAGGTPLGVYYWHVRAEDSIGNSSAWTSPWKITVADQVHVHILKYIDDVLATSESAGGLSFPMSVSWQAVNVGGGAPGSGSYTLNSSGSGTTTPYAAVTLAFDPGADYATSEIIDNSTVYSPDAEICPSDKFQFVGYRTGETLADAEAADATSTAPSFEGLTSDKYVIVGNTPCTPPPACNVNASSVYMSDETTQSDPETFTLVPHSSWATIAGTDWIWNEYQDGNTDSAPVGTVTFSKEFSIVGTPLGATLEITADNGYSVSVNGHDLSGISGCFSDEDQTWNSVHTCTIPAGTLLPGANVLSIDATNFGPPEDYTGPNPGGLTYKLTVENNECVIPDVHVHIYKYIDGELVTSESVDGISFPMIAVWDEANIGSGSGGYSLDASGSGTTTPYAAMTIALQAGADYSTHEVTDGDPVFPAGSDFCPAGKYQLQGYRVGSTLAEAEGATLTTEAPAFTNLASDKYVIVENLPCASLRTTVNICKVDDNENPLSGWRLMLKGTHVEDVTVPANTSAGATTVNSLSSGISYLVRATGTWLNSGGNGGSGNTADAEFVTTDDWASHTDGPPISVDQLDLQVNNGFVDWGTYNSDHSYAYSFVPVADGTASFRIFDGQNGTPQSSWYSDNVGSLAVSIWQGYAGTTGENGCVSFEDVPFGDYTIGEELRDGWTNVSGLGEVSVSSESNEFTVVNHDTSTDTATLTLVKYVFGSSDGSFNFELTGATATTTSITTVEGEGSVEIALTPGISTITEIVPEGWTNTGMRCEYEGDSIGVAVSTSSEEVSADIGDEIICYFTNAPEGEEPAVVGYKWNDYDFNGSWQQSCSEETECTEEPGIEGWPIALGRVAGEAAGTEGDPIPVEIVELNLTGASPLGQFSLGAPEPGQYKLFEGSQRGWTPTHPDAIDSFFDIFYAVGVSLPDDFTLNTDNVYDVEVDANGDITITQDTSSEPQSLWFGNHRDTKLDTSTIISNDTDLATNSSITGQAYTVEWQVIPSGVDTPTGTVEIKANGGAGCSAPVEDGQCQITPALAGNYLLIAYYSGDAVYAVSNSDSPGVSHGVVDEPVTTFSATILTNPIGNGPPVGPGGIGFFGQVLGASTSAGGTIGEVLGASTSTCSALITSFMGQGKVNDPAQVMALQAFLDVENNAGLPITGNFGPLTTAAVKDFQIKYWQDILAPWVPFGLPTDHTPTGYAGKTTMWKINMLYCPDLNLPFPQLP